MYKEVLEHCISTSVFCLFAFNCSSKVTNTNMDLKSEELQAVDIDEKVEQRVLEQELDDSQRAEERRTM